MTYKTRNKNGFYECTKQLTCVSWSAYQMQVFSHSRPCAPATGFYGNKRKICQICSGYCGSMSLQVIIYWYSVLITKDTGSAHSFLNWLFC